MKFGVCGKFAQLPIAIKSGCDYFEPSVSELMSLSEEAYSETKKQVKDSQIKCEAFNVMLPASHKVTGPEVDLSKLRAYMDEALGRMAGLSGKIVVFGSAGARGIPESYDKAQALDQLAEFLTMLDPLLMAHEIALAIEPLNPGECNIINTVSDACDLAMRVNLHTICCLADWYHMALQRENTEGIWRAGNRLIHTHIANPAGRVYPFENDGQDYSCLRDALNEISYNYRMSIEGGTNDIEADLPKSITFLRSFFR